LLPDPQRLPSVEQLSTYPSIALFVRRAQAIKHNFQLTVQNAPVVAQICLRLDGLPLAIELAAARIRLLPPKSLLQRLEQRLRLLTGGANDLPPRHQTLRAAIDWSFDLLSEGEQRLFARIAVFAGGFSLEAAEAVCNGGSGLDVDVLDGLGSLISKSLLQQMEHDEEPRFTMLETIREYAEERLRAGDDVEVRRKHVDYFLSLAEASQSELSGAQQEAWLTRLEHEHGNLRAAIAWVCKQREVELALRLAGALSPFWHHHCHLSEGRDWLEAVLALPDPQIGRLRAQALHGAAMLAAEQGDAERAHSYMEESVPIYEAAGDQAGIALSLLSLGNVALKQGELEQARSRYEPSLALFQALGEQRMVARVLNNLGVIAYSQEDYAAARVLYGRSLAITRSLDEPYYVAAALSNLGEVACEEGDYEGARTLLLEALEIFQQLGDRLCCAISLEALAVVASHLGTTDEQQKQEAHRSAQLWGAAEALREAIAAPPDALGRAVQERAISAAQARLDQGAWEAAWLEGRAMSLEDVMESVV
jgi:tetratricopeptide (TPR) repeat protein